MPLSRAQLVRNRIGGKLRQHPGADVTDLRREMEIAAILDQAEAYARAWGKPTPEDVAAIAAIFRADRGDMMRGPVNENAPDIRRIPTTGEPERLALRRRRLASRRAAREAGQ